MKPRIGREVYIIYTYSIRKEKVFMIGKESFICEDFVVEPLDEDDENTIREYKYNDYNITWFTSLSAAKQKLIKTQEMCRSNRSNFTVKIHKMQNDTWLACYERRAEEWQVKQ